MSDLERELVVAYDTFLCLTGKAPEAIWAADRERFGELLPELPKMTLLIATEVWRENVRVTLRHFWEKEPTESEIVQWASRSGRRYMNVPVSVRG